MNGKVNMKLKILAMMALLVSVSAFADLDVLVVGPSQSFDNSETVFSAEAVADELRSILQGDASVGTVNVVFDDIWTNKTIDTAIGGSADTWVENYRCYSLVQYYFWPEGRDERLNELKSAASNTWDYVVLMDDPYLMANMPGVHAQGVKLVSDAAISGGAEVLLLMQWPGTTTSSSVAHFGEVAYRVGDAPGIRVIPAGYAWDSLSAKDISAQHPTPHGAYLAASAIYAELYDRSAATNSTYNVDTNVANCALSEVQTRKLSSQYSGEFNFLNPFAIRGIKQRKATSWDRGSSSEYGIMYQYENSNVLPYTGTGSEWTQVSSSEVSPAYPSSFYDFNIGRGNQVFESYKRYIVDTNYFSCSFAFPMQDHGNTGNETMRYGIDKRYYNGTTFYDGTDFGIGYRLINNNQLSGHGRCIPIRLLWSKMYEDNPTWTAYEDSWHMHNRLDAASASFLYTIFSGRCGVGTTGSSDYLYARRLGYETAWRMSTLQSRAPGFEVLPTAWNATNVTPSTSETLSVRFVNAPTSTVTVTAMPDNKFLGRVTPRYLTFTPANYTNEQTVTVSGETGPAGTYEFNIEFTTSSDDPVYQDLSDSWNFYNTRPDGPIPSSINIYGNNKVIMHDDFTPVSDNDTAYGNVIVDGGTVSHTFMITNTDVSATLYLTNTPAVQLIGGSGHFTLTQNAGDTNLAPEEFTSFTVEFDPASSGLQTTMVSVASTDTNSPIYTFLLEGFGVDDPVVGNEAYTSIDYDAVDLSATLTAGGTGDVFICWGTEDGGTTSTGDWQNVVSMGYFAQDAAYELNLLGLETNVTYWFRSYATNISGTAWSGNAVPFNGRVIGGSGIILEVDFDSLATGNIDGGGTTLAQLNEATIGGSWYLEPGVTHQIQDDASLTDDQGFSSRLGSAGTGSAVILDSPIDVENLRTNAVITFTSGTTDGTGITRDSHWKLLDGTDVLVDIEIDDGSVFLNGSNKGNLHSGADNNSIGTTWNTASDYLLDFEIIINSTGRVDVSVNDHGAGANTVSGNTSFDPSNDFDRIETSWDNSRTSPQMGIYFGEIMVTGLVPSQDLNGTSIQNLLPSNVSSNSADFRGSLNTTGNNDVYVHWGRTDQGASLTWDSSAFVGTYTNVSWSNLNYSAQYLSGGSEYYYTFRAVSDAGTIWASPTWKVTTLPGPTIALQNKEATGIWHNRADLNATLYASDTNYDVYVHWNTSDGVEDADAWTNSAFIGSWTNVAVTNISFYRNGLQNDTQYYYRFRGANDSGDAWGQPSIMFTTTAPTNPPVITTVPAENVLTDSADIKGSLTSTGDAPVTVWAFWGDNDAGQGTWDNSIDFGVNDAVPPVSYSTNITGLTEGMTYYYRFYATNDLGESWGDVSSFEALATPVVNNNGATDLSASSADLQATLTAGGFAAAWICWDTSDAGTSSTGNWANVEAVGSVTQNVAFSKAVSGLETNVSYWYRCYVTNAAGTDWSDDATFFSGTPGGSNGAPVGGVGTILSVDFDSLSTGEIDNGGATPAQLNDATMGGTWSLEAGVTHQIQADANSTSDQGFSSRLGSAGTGSAVILSDPLDIDQLTTNVVITFTSGTTDGTGFTRKTHWKLLDGSNSVLDIMLDDGHLEIREGPRWQGDIGGYTDLGILFLGSDTECIGTTWDTSSGHLLDFEITIDSTGRVDVSVNDHGGGGSTDTVIGSITTDTTHNFDRIEISWDNGRASPPMGIYFGEIQITGPNPASSSMQNLAPANITDSGAVLNAVLGSHLSSNTVYVHWGTTDEGTNFGWDSSALVGGWNDVISTNVSYNASLSEGTTYYYTFRATNDNGQLWASPSWQFQTLGTAAAPEVTTNYSVPHTWLETQDSEWTNDFEAAVTNDPDGDGYSTWEEYWAGTDPNNSNSVFKIDQVIFDGTNVVLKWRHANVDVGNIPPIAVQRRFDLSTGDWSYVGQKIPQDGTNTWNGAPVTKAFYRITVTNTP
ncbi:hypothetical protein BVX94_01225 [bacterium B17]|nr:hypothetical protein BVX94_01225 [bacterium B17]